MTTLQEEWKQLSKAWTGLGTAILATPEAKWLVHCLEAIAAWLNKLLGGR